MTTTPPQPERGIGSAQDGDIEGRMSFLDHLTELRKRLIYSLIAVGVGAVIGLSISEKMLEWVALPMQHALQHAHQADKLIYTSPTGVIGLVIKLGFYLGFVIASPFVFYQVWLFVAPGLYRHERRAVATFVISSVALFLSGIAFAYFFMLPYVLRFLISFQGPFTPLISINEYFDLSLLVLIGLGLLFELPVLIFFLSLIGVATPRFLWKNMRYAILIIAVVAAVFTPTPGDIMMLVFMALMLLLYIVGIGVSYLVVRSKRRAAMAQAGER
ncbi:MAG TPA: twin-arginine translocase subunit TatC [Patescibacteria group bacterium]|nr:twin-arginine translocase subunit TatC [Patescibacteria group bacterium]